MLKVGSYFDPVIAVVGQNSPGQGDPEQYWSMDDLINIFNELGI